MVSQQPLDARLRFGLGLIGIGRPWGHAGPEVPDEARAREFLETAWRLGVRYFDTAPSYGVSEERLGRFLASLATAERAQAQIATKFGEHWDAARAEPFVDHSYDALARSLERSAALLGRIDYLQLHKTTPAVLGSAALERAWEFAHSLGITQIGASVSDLESARMAALTPAFSIMQAPYNMEQEMFGEVLEEASARGMLVAVNRPFGMGRLLYERPGMEKCDAFAFVARRAFRGLILSGTKSPGHLAENWRAFAQATHEG
jgi:aryl-alcohol dehydrogenase-like predicted oxidoreductase